MHPDHTHSYIYMHAHIQRTAHAHIHMHTYLHIAARRGSWGEGERLTHRAEGHTHYSALSLGGAVPRAFGGELLGRGTLIFQGRGGQIQNHLEAGQQGGRRGAPHRSAAFVRPPLSAAVKVSGFGFSEGSGWFELLALAATQLRLLVCLQSLRQAQPSPSLLAFCTTRQGGGVERKAGVGVLPWVLGCFLVQPVVGGLLPGLIPLAGSSHILPSAPSEGVLQPPAHFRGL